MARNQGTQECDSLAAIPSNLDFYEQLQLSDAELKPLIRHREIQT
jgi:hypothetical protein